MLPYLGAESRLDREFKQDFKTWASDAYIVKSGDTHQLKAAIRDLLARP